jgi:hypothetical protein
MRSRTLWIVAAVLTVACAAYQRVTGPTWPARGTVELAGEEIRYRLPRSHAGPGDAAIAVRAPTDARGTLSFRRHATNDAWTSVAMLRRGDELTALLPHQPPAGKLDYSIFVIRATEGVALGGPITLRFRGDVPPWVLVPHILLMFLGMLWATRAGLEKLASEPRYAGLIVWTLILLGVGGLLLGPAVQKFSFGEWWTGWPYGTDLTDNKTAVAWLAWVAAWFANRRAPRSAGWWVVAAAVLTLAVFAIPHSLFGSEIRNR